MKTTEGGPLVEQVRRLVCRVFARVIDSGSCALRIRLEQSGDEPVGAWFYSHTNTGWEKQPEHVTDHGQLEAVRDEMDLLASKGRGDAVSCRDHASGTHRDLDLHVRPDRVRDRGAEPLEVTVLGLLFCDGHDSLKDSRRRVRFPR